MQLSRARRLSSERTMYQGACLLSAFQETGESVGQTHQRANESREAANVVPKKKTPRKRGQVACKRNSWTAWGSGDRGAVQLALSIGRVSCEKGSVRQGKNLPSADASHQALRWFLQGCAVSALTSRVSLPQPPPRGDHPDGVTGHACSCRCGALAVRQMLVRLCALNSPFSWRH